MSSQANIPNIPEEKLLNEIKAEYGSVAQSPDKGYHFHTGQRALAIHDYDESLYAGIPEGSVESFSGTGNPFSAGSINPGETVIDIGSGAGVDSLIASRMVGDEGHVIGIDMTEEMRDKARESAQEMGATNVEFREGLATALPLPDNYADAIISNGVLNLWLNKTKTLTEWFRVLKPGGRLQIGDIIINRAIPSSALDDISLWTG